MKVRKKMIVKSESGPQTRCPAKKIRSRSQTQMCEMQLFYQNNRLGIYFLTVNDDKMKDSVYLLPLYFLSRRYQVWSIKYGL